MSYEPKYSFTKLNGENYFNWRFKIEMIMKEKGVWSTINEEAPNPATQAWKEKDEKAQATICLSCEDDQLTLIRDKKTASEMWTALKNFHEKDNQGNRVNIMRTIMRQRLEEGGNMETHVNRMNELFQRLKALGDEIKPEVFMGATLLGSLPESYDAMVTALEVREEKEITVTTIASKLIDEYKRRIQRQQYEKDTSVALKVGQFSNSNFACYFCKHKGHLKKDCTKYKAWLQKQNGKQKVNLARNKEDYNYLFTISSSDGWIIDSGATCHIVGNKDLFTEFNAEWREKVYVANGEQLTAFGKGTISVNFVNKSGEINKIKIPEVLYIPDIKGCLISVKRLAQEGFTVNFDNHLCEIKKDNIGVAVGDIIDGLYKLRTTNTVCVAQNVKSNCIHEWHSILGHRDIEVVKTLCSNKLVDGVTFDKCTDNCKKKLNCEICLQGKMTRLKFPQKSENRRKNILDLVHSDVCGPMQTKSLTGKQYFLTFIDDHSKYTSIYILSNKSEVIEKFKEYVEMCKNMFNKRPKFIRTDNGGEYVNKAFHAYLQQEGIQIQRTAPYSPQQNGLAERKNRTIVEMARCMIFEGEMENKFWAEAVTMANYVQNRLPARDIDKTTYESWYGIKPSLNHCKRFGSKCFVFVPNERRQKLDPKSVAAILVGYDSDSKAYRCYVPVSRKVIVSRDIKFIDKSSNWKIDHNKEESSVTIIPKYEVTDEEDQQIMNQVEENQDENNQNEVNTEELPNEVNTEELPNEVNTEELPNEVNTEVLLRRSSRSTKGIPPRRLIEEIDIVSQKELMEPKSFNEAITLKEKDKWVAAMQEELSSLQKNNTWDIVELPEKSHAIGCKWVYKIKRNSKTNTNQFKARLVAQGFSQKYGTDYDEVFAPVVRQATFRTLLVIASKNNFKVWHLDCKTAFLNGKLDETIYMKQPPGFPTKDKENHVCLLRRSLYGLKQSARVWNKTICDVLINAGYIQSKNDQCLFTFKSGDKLCFVLIYVDDLLIASKYDCMLRNCEQTLSSCFEIKNLGEIENYLGLQISKTDKNIFKINQSTYIAKVIKDFGLENAKSSVVPINMSYEKGAQSEMLINNEQYRRLIGCLLYISVNSRPDISASVSILAQKVSHPTQEDWNETKRVVKYLKGTINLSLVLGKVNNNSILVGYADANWAESKFDRKSNSGYIFQVFGGTVSWCCKRQTCVSLSSTEAEFIALSEASKEAQWLRRILEDFCESPDGPTIIYEDNQGCLKMIKEEKFSNRSKHIDVRFYFVKDFVEKGEIMCIYCPTEDMVADMLTKPLNSNRLKFLREKCNLTPSE